MMQALMRLLPASLVGQVRFVVVLLVVLGGLLASVAWLGGQRVRAAMDRADHAQQLREALDATVRGVGELILTEGSKSARELVQRGRRGTDEVVVVAAQELPALAQAPTAWKTLAVHVDALLAVKRPNVEDEATMLAYGKLSGSVGELQTQVGAAADAAVQEAHSTVGWVMTALLAGTGFLVVAAGLSGVGLLRQIRWRLGGEPRDVVRALRSVVEGDLSAPIEVPRDAPRSIVAEMGKMQDSLRSIVGSIRGSANEIASAASQIAAGNLDLSGRTEQTASNLEQTASSVEQMAQSVQGSAQTASRAAQLANEASRIASQSGSDVAEVVSTMQRIDGASKRIADIIGVIDTIAFQTNILALNAAVEAARAGDQGRGFAVVASEVRALAQRSAQAAREIKQLIGSSVDEVGQGMVRVQAAGQTVAELVSSVDRVAQMIGEISTASSEESRGIELLAHTVSDLDKMTQQNAALVEEAAASANSLSALAAQLVVVVGDFKLEATDRR